MDASETLKLPIFNINYRHHLQGEVVSDRFIPFRSLLNKESGGHCAAAAPAVCESLDVFGETASSTPRRSYERLLRDALSVRSERVFSFGFTGASPGSPVAAPRAEMRHADWPVRARKKPLLGTPEMVLDTPVQTRNGLHWGRNNVLAAAFSERIYLWDADTCRVRAVEDLHAVVTTVRWAGTAGHLAYGTDVSVVYLHDETVGRSARFQQCLCNGESRVRCGTTALAWDPGDQLLATGCSLGRLILWCVRTATLVAQQSAASRPLNEIKFCPHENFIATTSQECCVKVWTYPSLRPHLQIDCRQPVRAIDWHPWCASTLAVAGKAAQHSVSVWKVSTRTQIKYHTPQPPAIIDCLAWSDLTGELIVSYWKPDDLLNPYPRPANTHPNAADTANPPTSPNRVVVFASFTNIVDTIQMNARIHDIIWSPDGLQVGLVANDETMSIFNYLGSSLHVRDQALRAKQKIQTYYQDSTYPFNISHTLTKFKKQIR